MTDISSRIFMGAAYLLDKIQPGLKVRLRQAHISGDSTTYLSKTILYSLLSSLVVFTCIVAILRLYGRENIYLGPGLAIIVLLFMFYHRITLPNMIVKKRVNDIEKNLAFAVQSLYIQISSGVLIFDAMVSIASGKYGEISREFEITTNEIKLGKPITEALEELAARNPSNYFQEIIWQIVNTIRTGGNLAYNLEYISSTVSRDQITVVKSYGAKLSPLSMAYMMVAVIVPSLGVTVLITVSSLPGMAARINTDIFWTIFIVTLILQVQFAMIIRSSRPHIIG